MHRCCDPIALQLPTISRHVFAPLILIAGLTNSPDPPRQVALIAPLGPDNTAAQREADRLKKQWENLAPHHLAWVDPSTSKTELFEHASQLKAVPGTDTMALGQVACHGICFLPTVTPLMCLRF